MKVLGETVYRRLALIERDIAPAAVPDRSDSTLEYRPMQPHELDEYVEFKGDADCADVARRLERGDLCFLAREHGAIVHSHWTATGSTPIDYLGCDVRLAPGVVYVYEVYTAPEFRGRSLAVACAAAVRNHYFGCGYRRLLAAVWPENRPVFRSLEKAGYAVVGRIGYRGFGRWRRYFCHYAGSDPPLYHPHWSGHRRQQYGGEYWDRVSVKLDGRTHHLDPFLGQLKQREHLRLVRQWGGLRRDGRLLKTDLFEEAMGPDAFLAELADEAGETVGIDVSPALAQRAAERFPGGAVRYLTADVRNLPFMDARFSTIVSPSTLDHFSDPSDLGVSLEELFHVLLPGGRLVITLDNRQNVFDPVLRLLHRLGMVPFYLGRSYTARELRDELERAGFEVRETTAILHNPRLVATGTMRLVRWLRWRWLIDRAQRILLAAQRLEHTRWCYYTGSFVAALAVRPQTDAGSETAGRPVRGGAQP